MNGAASPQGWRPGGLPTPNGVRDAFCVFFAALVVYALTSPGGTDYDQYALFAQALLKGSLSLPQRPVHLEMAEFEGRAYFTNPPTPALLLLPFVWIAETEPIRGWLTDWNGGWSLPLGVIQTSFSILLGAVNVALARVALGRAPVSRRAANWGAVLFGFGSIHWYHATVGSVWYLAQIVHASAIWLLMIEWLGRARALPMGLALAAAFWCRMETIVAVPFVLVARPECWLLPRAEEIVPRPRLGWLVRLAMPLVGILALNAAYNWVRFGVFENWAYRMIVEKPDVAWIFPHGLMSWEYWPRHVQVLFKKTPIFLNTYPWAVPSVGGLAIWITTPAFVYALRAPLDRLTAACWLGVALFMTVLLRFGGDGMSQFGYRFALDFYPLLVLLTVRGMDRGFRWWHAVLIATGVLVNLWGVWVLNILEIERLY